jgi:hypothetical protein
MAVERDAVVVELGGSARQRSVRFGGPRDIEPVAEAARRFFGSRFAGDWFTDEGRRRRYVVAAVGLLESEAEEFARQVDGRSRWLRLVDARYSEADLERFNEAVTDILVGRTLKVASWGPSVHKNCITVTLHPEDVEGFRPALEAVVPGDALAFEVAELEYRI